MPTPFDMHMDDPEFGYRNLVEESREAGESSVWPATKQPGRASLPCFNGTCSIAAAGEPGSLPAIRPIPDGDGELAGTAGATPPFYQGISTA